MDWLRRVMVGPRTLLVAFVTVGFLAGILLLGSSNPGARTSGSETAGGDPSPVAASEDEPEARGGERQRSGLNAPRSQRFDLGMDIPKAPPREPAWKQAQQRFTSAPWQFDEDEMPKILYLTFDDGPYPTYTEQILAALDRYDARATFFQLGEVRQEFPELVEKVRAAGHTIGNHSTTHSTMTALSESGMRRELEGSADSKCFRPPYGAINDAVNRLLRDYGMRSILWDIDTLDWKQPPADTLRRQVVRDAFPGAIVLMHDGGGERAQTAAALPGILSELKSQGYEFHALPC